jgi:kinesin family protein 11
MLQMEVINSQMRSVKEEYDHTLALLERRERELEEIKELFRIKSVDLEKAEEELVGVREALEEETIVKRALERGEERLDKVAGELKGVVEASLSDVEGLFEKLGAYFRCWVVSARLTKVTYRST